jgi:anti-sigma B factor antagonist
MSPALFAEFSRIREERQLLDHLHSNLFNHLMLVLALLQIGWILGRACACLCVDLAKESDEGAREMSSEIDTAGEGAGKDDSIAIHGRITVENSGEMNSALANALREKPAKLSVDLSGVSYIDTSGLATLLQAAGVARKQGTRLVLDALQDQPRYLLEITRFDRLFDIEGQEPSR